MTTIKTTCSGCGDVHLTPGDIALELTSSSDEGVYTFTCPLCNEFQRRPANARVVSVLLATGVASRVIEDGPITEEEIARFAAALDAEPDPSRLLAGCPVPAPVAPRPRLRARSGGEYLPVAHASARRDHHHPARGPGRAGTTAPARGRPKDRSMVGGAPPGGPGAAQRPREGGRRAARAQTGPAAAARRAEERPRRGDQGRRRGGGGGQAPQVGRPRAEVGPHSGRRARRPRRDRREAAG